MVSSTSRPCADAIGDADTLEAGGGTLLQSGYAETLVAPARTASSGSGSGLGATAGPKQPMTNKHAANALLKGTPFANNQADGPRRKSDRGHSGKLDALRHRARFEDRPTASRERMEDTIARRIICATIHPR